MKVSYIEAVSAYYPTKHITVIRFSHSTGTIGITQDEEMQMATCDLETKNKVLAEIEKAERLIGDIADEFGLSHRMVYDWVRVTRSSRKQATAAKREMLNKNRENSIKNRQQTEETIQPTL